MLAEFLEIKKQIWSLEMIQLSKEDVMQAFFTAHLEENYNFLEGDLINLANAFIKAAEPEIAKLERAECVKVARSVNHLVADKIEEVRGK